MRVLDLFSGIGGISLGLERAGMTTVAFCEIDPFCRAVLRKHWPEVPIHDDIRSLDAAALRGRVDLVAGGFPCQPVSCAGKRKGEEDDRWLWPEMLRVVRDVRPGWVLAENVPGLRTLGADRVLEDLESEGYACWPLVVGADDAGAPHRRKRVWVVAHRSGSRILPGGRVGAWVCGSGDDPADTALHEGWDSRGSVEQHVRHDPDDCRGSWGTLAHGNGTELRDESWRSRRARRAGASEPGGCGTPLAHGNDWRRECQRLEEPGGLGSAPGHESDRCRATGSGGVAYWPSRPGEPQHAWEEPRLVNAAKPGRVRAHELEDGRHGERGGWRPDAAEADDVRGLGAGEGTPARPAQPQMGAATDGLPVVLAGWRRASLKATGNSVVPQVVEAIGRAILKVQHEQHP